MTEGDLVRIVFSAGAAFEQELPVFADDEQLGRLARPAGKFDDGVDDADVKVRKHDGQFLGREIFARLNSVRTLLAAGVGNFRGLRHESSGCPPRARNRAEAQLIILLPVGRSTNLQVWLQP